MEHDKALIATCGILNKIVRDLMKSIRLQRRLSPWKKSLQRDQVWPFSIQAQSYVFPFAWSERPREAFQWRPWFPSGQVGGLQESIDALPRASSECLEATWPTLLNVPSLSSVLLPLCCIYLCRRGPFPGFCVKISSAPPSILWVSFQTQHGWSCLLCDFWALVPWVQLSHLL